MVAACFVGTRYNVNISMEYLQGIIHFTPHQEQNGLLLCNKCHSQFDNLKRYVDFVDDNLVARWSTKRMILPVKNIKNA